MLIPTSVDNTDTDTTQSYPRIPYMSDNIWVDSLVVVVVVVLVVVVVVEGGKKKEGRVEFHLPCSLSKAP